MGRRMNRRQALYEAAAAPAPPPPASATSAAAPEDRYETLRKLAELHASGVLTDDEFETEKAKILQQG